MLEGASSRRRFLRGVATVTTGVGLAGCGFGQEDEEDEEDQDREETEGEREADDSTTGIPDRIQQGYAGIFDSIVNVVDAGADNSGMEPVDEVISDALSERTLLYFPSGQYTMNPLRVRDVDTAGFISQLGEQTRLVPAVHSDQMDEFLHFSHVSNFIIEGLDFDFRKPGYGGVVKLIANGDFVARGLRIRGKLPDKNTTEPHVGFRFDVRKPRAHGLVERVRATDGGHQGGNGVGIYVGKEHAGTLRFEDCEIANFPNNGLYASAPGRNSPNYKGEDGIVHVRGGQFRNNNIANVRIGSTDSTVKGAEVIVDEVPPHQNKRTLNVRGIRLRASEGQLVENCRIEIGPNAGRGFGAISYHPDHGSSTIRDTEIQVDRDGYNAVHATDADKGGTKAPLTFENVRITGSASDEAAIQIADRNGTEFRRCNIEQVGSNRDGILLTRSQNCKVVDTTLRVTGVPLRKRNSSVERINLKTERISL